MCLETPPDNLRDGTQMENTIKLGDSFFHLSLMLNSSPRSCALIDIRYRVPVLICNSLQCI